MVFTRRRLTVCVVGAMCSSAPPAEGFTPPGCLAPVCGAAESFFCAAERRLAATGGPSQGGERGGRAVARVSMASSSRIAPAGSRVAARSGAAKAAASVARKRGRNRKPKAGGGGGGGGAADRYDAAVAGSVGSGRVEGQPLQQQHPKLKEEPRAAVAASATTAAAAAAANPPPAKGFRRKESKKRVVASDRRPPGASSSPKTTTATATATAATSPVASLSSPPSSSPAAADSLAAYFKTLKKIKLLKPDEEVVLGRRIQRGLQLERVRDRLHASQGAAPTHGEWAASLNLTKGEMLRELAAADAAKRHMISANLRLVVNMARGYKNRGLEMPDLIQEGTMGLVKATEKFNPEAGFKFSSYAIWWIKQSLLRGIANQSRVVRLPSGVHAFLSSIRKYTYELTVDGKLPTDEELGDKLGASVQKIQHYRRAALSTEGISLESRQENKKADGGADELGDRIGDTKNPDPEDASQAFYMKGKVTALLATLKEKERKVVRARYGLDGATSKTLEQIGKELGYTRERVRQIEGKALSKLRQPYRNYRVREHKTGQVLADMGLREPDSEAVSAARALIAEAERLETQQPAAGRLAAAADEGKPPVAAAGDRPLKIEFKRGVKASEATQAVEAVLVAALDRAPAATAAGAAVSAPGGAGAGAGASDGSREQPAFALREKTESREQQPEGIRLAEKPQTGSVLAGAGSPSPVGAADGGGRSSAGRLDVPGVTLTPGSRRLLPDMESSERSADADRLGSGRGSDELVDAGGNSLSGSTFAVEERPLAGAGADLPAAAAAALTPEEEQRALEIESKRKSLDKAWNKKSEAAVDRLERELAQSMAALAMLEVEQEEWERSAGDVAAQPKSLSLASL